VLQKAGTGQKFLVEYYRPIEANNKIKWERQTTYVQLMTFRDLYGEYPLKIERAWISENSIDEPVLNVSFSM
jgi:hypothetical protein